MTAQAPAHARQLSNMKTPGAFVSNLSPAPLASSWLHKEEQAEETSGYGCAYSYVGLFSKRQFVSLMGLCRLR
jgi:hypothetical protein